jgi:hypothetical protein
MFADSLSGESHDYEVGDTGARTRQVICARRIGRQHPHHGRWKLSTTEIAISAQLLPVSNRNKSGPIKRMSAQLFRAAAPEDLQIRGAYRLASTLSIHKVLSV